MTSGLRLIPFVIAFASTPAWLAAEDIAFRTAMNHIHGRAGGIMSAHYTVGDGTLEVSDQGIRWTEKREASVPSGSISFQGNQKHSFSAKCGEIREATLHFSSWDKSNAKGSLR